MHPEPHPAANLPNFECAASLPGNPPPPPDASPAWLKTIVLEAMRAATPPTYLRWINAAVGANVRLLSVDDVLFFRSDTKYTLVVMQSAEVLIRRSLRELRGELDPTLWWTVHRSTIVNVRAINEVKRQADGRTVISLKQSPHVLSVSDTHARQFRQM